MKWGVLVLASWVLVGCGARVPAVFSPAPPRLDASEVTYPDLSDRNQVVVLVFGDAGTGENDQREVGRRMTEVCRDLGCDLGLMLGDNIYENGVHPPEDGIWDAAFGRQFEAPYRDLGPVLVWTVAGNHDWHGGRSSVDTEIAYSRVSPRWRMPAYDYAIPGLPDWLRIYGLDTTVLGAGVSIGQRARAEEWLCANDGWKVLMAHHSVYSHGQHGGRNRTTDFMKTGVEPLLGRCGVRLVLSGHDHHQEHLSADGYEQIVQGAAGRLRPVSAADDRSPATQRFAASQYGFATIAFTPETANLRFYGYPRGNPDAFRQIYEVTFDAPARRE